MKYTLPVLVTFLSFCAQAQVAKVNDKRNLSADRKLSNIERYQLDYELKDFVFVDGDSTILNAINLDAIEQVRLQGDDIEVFDYENDVTIILYSKDALLQLEKKGTTIPHSNVKE